MLRHRLAPLGAAGLLFILTILFMGQITQKFVNTYIKPGVIETAAESPVPDLFQGTILQSIVISNIILLSLIFQEMSMTCTLCPIHPIPMSWVG